MRKATNDETNDTRRRVIESEQLEADLRRIILSSLDKKWSASCVSPTV